MTPRLRRLADQEVTGWKRYGVLLDDEVVGMVVEDHEWKGWRYGGIRWDVVHVHELHQSECWDAKPACWASRSHRTRSEALRALRLHLEGPR